MKPGEIARIFLFLVILGPGFLLVAWAQPNTLTPGDTIRVTSQEYSSSSMIGTFTGLRNDTLIFKLPMGKVIAIPLQRIRKLEVAQGKRKNTRKGALIGAISGGLGLGLILAVAVSNEQDEWFTPTPGQAFLAGSFLGGIPGGLTGAIIGSGSKSTHWVEVPVKTISVKEKAAVPPAQTKKQKTAQSERKQTRRWRVSVTLGTTSSGPARGIEKAMRRDGWDETSPGGWFGGPVDHPFSNTGIAAIGAPWSLQIAYSLTRTFDGAILLGHNPIGSTHGYHKDPANFLFLNYCSTIISPVLIFKLSGMLQLGGGPAWFINKIEQESGSEIIYRKSKGQPGAVLLATLTFPKNTRFFVKLDGQFRWMPSATFGPFKDTYRGTSLAQLQPFEANFSHAFVDFGFGIRF